MRCASPRPVRSRRTVALLCSGLRIPAHLEQEHEKDLDPAVSRFGMACDSSADGRLLFVGTGEVDDRAFPAPFSGLWTRRPTRN